MSNSEIMGSFCGGCKGAGDGWRWKTGYGGINGSRKHIIKFKKKKTGQSFKYCLAHVGKGFGLP